MQGFYVCDPFYSPLHPFCDQNYRNHNDQCGNKSDDTYQSNETGSQLFALVLWCLDLVTAGGFQCCACSCLRCRNKGGAGGHLGC